MTTPIESITPTESTPTHVILLSIAMWTVLMLGLIGVMVVFLLN